MTGDESGETLVEILVALLIIGVIVSAIFAAIATTSTASKAHRDLVTADAVLRDYAEATKNAVRDQTTGCGKPSPTTFTVSFTPPAGFAVSSTPSLTGQACPPSASNTPLPVQQLFVTMPNGRTKELDIVVRTP
jgi:Tfp pilus assembly protein PilV